MTAPLIETNSLLAEIAKITATPLPDTAVLRAIGSILHDLSGNTPALWHYDPAAEPLNETDYATILVLDAVGMWSAEDGSELTGSSMGWEDDYSVICQRIDTLNVAGDVLARRVHKLAA